jgi:hypothetical protein
LHFALTQEADQVAVQCSLPRVAPTIVVHNPIPRTRKHAQNTPDGSGLELEKFPFVVHKFGQMLMSTPIGNGPLIPTAMSININDYSQPFLEVRDKATGVKTRLATACMTPKVWPDWLQ